MLPPSPSKHSRRRRSTIYSEDQDLVSSQTNGYPQPRGESLFLALFCLQVYVPQAECGQLMFCVSVCGPRFCYLTALI